MLVLSRKFSESLIIGDDIKITILEICGKRVRIGIEAPQSVKIYRNEIYAEIQLKKDVQLEGNYHGDLKNEEKATTQTETQV
jgi:carbon storage regulator